MQQGGKARGMVRNVVLTKDERNKLSDIYLRI